MKAGTAVGLIVVGLTLAAAPAEAQRVSADIHIQAGDRYSTYRRPPAQRVVVVERDVPRAIVVERFQHRNHRKDWRHYGYRPVTIYYNDGRFFESWRGRGRGRGAARQIVVFERGGHYYADWANEWYERDRDGRFDRDRFDFDRDRRWDDDRDRSRNDRRGR
jgi:hypothetical protein